MKTAKPRNPYALAARQRKAGAHGKSEKTQRRDARQQLKSRLASWQGRGGSDEWEETGGKPRGLPFFMVQREGEAGRVFGGKVWPCPLWGSFSFTENR